MPSSPMVALSTVSRLLSGGTPSKSNPSFWNGTIPWLTPKDMGRWNGKTDSMVSSTAIGNGTRLAPANSIFVAVRGMSLHTEIRIIKSEQALTFNQDIKAIVPTEAIDVSYLYYVLLANKGALLANVESSGHGTGVLHTERLNSLQIPMCRLSEQRAIANVLRALDAKISLNRRMNATLEIMARTIFKDWFVDYGPTLAKMEGRAPYLSPDLLSLFPNRLDSDGKPERWSVSTIGQEVDVVGGSTPRTTELTFWGGDIAWATPKDLSSLQVPVLFSTERKISDAGLEQIGSGLLPVGTVLLSSRAPIGYLAISQIPIAVNQGFIAMICKKRLSNVFVWLWAQANMDKVHQNANGSTFQEISKANFRPLKVVVATPELLSAFNQTTMPWLNRIVANEKESQSLTDTRDILLPKLMSGGLSVSVAEEKVGELL